MKSILVTTRSNQFGGVLGTAYRHAGGPPFSAVIVLPERKDLGWTAPEQAYAAWKMLGPFDTLRMMRYRCGGYLLRPAERSIGLHADWIGSISDEQTRLVELDDINTAEAADRIRALAPDLLVSIGTPTILRRHVLEIPSWGAVNLHNGRLPRYRGHFATFWERLHDEEWGYVSLHEMVPRVDAGRILAEERVALRESRSLVDVLISKKQLGGQLLARVVLHASAVQAIGPSGGPVHDTPSGEPCYFGWPRIQDLRKLGRNTRRRAA